jgi:acyl carrier protein
MVSERTLYEVFKLDDRITFEEIGSGCTPDGPAGSQVRVTKLQLKVLLAFQTPTSVIRALAMADSDEERSALTEKVNDWIGAGILRASETHHGATPVITMTNSACGNLFFIYTGVQGGMMMNPLEFLQQAGLSDQNIVLLRDPSQRWFLDGIGGRIAGWSELAAWQSGYLEGAVHAKRHYCMGSSMGAFSAIVFGHILKAHAVWSFGLARTAVPILNSEQEPWNLERLLEVWNGVSRYHLYFNESSPVDRDAAMRLARLPGVELHPQDGEGHLVLDYLRRTGKLATTFPRHVFDKTARTGVGRDDGAREGAVLEALKSVVPQYADTIDVTTSLAGILDSFALVSLLERLERDLGVELDPGRLKVEDFENAASIAQAIARESKP